MGRFLAIDYGSKRVGLAISDPTKKIAKAYKTITNDSLDALLYCIKNEIKKNSVEKIILGLPIGMNGKNTSQTELVLKFNDMLKNFLSIPVVLEDERLTSLHAKKSLVFQGFKTTSNKENIDSTAAALLLQNYINKSIFNADKAK
tara:strand:+ start:5224 stop:5658 length:435 start_codon:yes stop_codon:yes gene_type:complete